MDNKLVNHLSVTIEKISYLFRNVRRGDGTIKKLEMALLKQYVMDLYEGLLELEKTAPKLNLEEMIDNIAKQPQISKDELQTQAPVVVAVSENTPPPPTPNNEETPLPQNNQEEAENLDFLNTPAINATLKNDHQNSADDDDEDDTTGKKPKKILENTGDSSANIWDFIKNKSQQVKSQLNTLEDKIEDKWEKIEDKWEAIEDKVEDKWKKATEPEPPQNDPLPQYDENATVKMDRQISEPLELPQDFKKAAKTQVLDDLVKSHAFDEWNAPQNPAILPSTHTQEEATIAMKNTSVNEEPTPKNTPPKSNNEPSVSSLAYFNIGINDKMRFVNELFKGDANEFTTHLNQLAQAKNYIEALTHINLNVRYDFNWKEDDPTAKEFLEIIKTKFWS